MKILFIGTRGIPANYSGFEICVQEVTKRLENNHELIVYARKGHYDSHPEKIGNIRVVYLPALNSKSFETLSHTFLSVFHALIFHWSAVYMVFNAANSFALILPWLFRRKIAINTDGLEWERDKWNQIGKWYFQAAAWFSTKIGNVIVADGKEMSNYYLERWNCPSSIIEYGAYVCDSNYPSVLNQYNVEPGKYILQITRFEPENNPLLTMRSFKQFKKDNPESSTKLVLVGGVPYESDYSRMIQEEVTKDIIIPGYIFDKNILAELRNHSLTYIHGNQVGGTNPALLEAMGSHCLIIARDVNFNREVLENGGLYYQRNETNLAEQMTKVYKNEIDRNAMISFCIHKIKTYYNWDRIAVEYEKMIVSL